MTRENQTNLVVFQWIKKSNESCQTADFITLLHGYLQRSFGISEFALCMHTGSQLSFLFYSRFHTLANPFHSRSPLPTNPKLKKVTVTLGFFGRERKNIKTTASHHKDTLWTTCLLLLPWQTKKIKT